MRTFEADDVPHRTRDLSAYDAFHLYRRLAPVLPVAVALDLTSGTLNAGTVAEAMRGIAPEDIKAAFTAAASAVERDDGEGWRPGTHAVPLPDMIVIVLSVVEANLAAFFNRKIPQFKPTPTPRALWQAVGMPDGESWLFRPCRSDPPLIEMLALFDGRATLFHVAKANDLLDVEAENETRALAAAERKR